MAHDINEKIQKYELFINDVLKEDLKKIVFRRDRVLEDLAQMVQLKNTLQSIVDLNIQEGFKCQMNLGCDFYAQANVTNTQKVYIDIGLGHYLEFTLEAALKFIDKRTLLLQKQITKLAQDSADNKATIKLVLGGIHELQKG